MFTTVLLIASALAHTKLITPTPKFLSPSENDFPAECNKITYQNNAPAKNIETFTGMLKEKYGGSLLAYFTDCGSNSPKTDHNAQVPIPKDGRVVMDNHSHHPGLYEIYIDDIKVASGAWQDGEHPESIPIDYSKCASGTCKFRYMMAAVHAQPIQLYDNIVTITGAPSYPVAPVPVPAPAPVVSSAAAKASPVPSASTTAAGSAATPPAYATVAAPVITSSAAAKASPLPSASTDSAGYASTPPVYPSVPAPAPVKHRCRLRQ